MNEWECKDVKLYLKERPAGVSVPLKRSKHSKVIFDASSSSPPPAKT